MKTMYLFVKKMIVLTLLFGITNIVSAQNSQPKESLTVLQIDSKGISLDPEQLGNLTRIEIGKTNIYEVLDKYDILYAIEKNKINSTNCYSKYCICEIGKLINVDKIITGSVELYGETIIITFRLIDIKTETIYKTQIKEFLNLQNDIQSMIKLTIFEMFSIPKDSQLELKLTKKNNYESAINTPNENILELNGPRMGATLFTGETASILASPKADGGFEALPVMFQFGYQFEKQYLNEGNFQALVEFIPMVTGIDQGYFMPSFTILNGIRNNMYGWEFAIGPTFYTSKESSGYIINGKWKSMSDLTDAEYMVLSGKPSSRRLDSNGSLRFKSGVIIAMGKTFKSGKLNIPVNLFIAPKKEGIRFGVSFGYNARK